MAAKMANVWRTPAQRGGYDLHGDGCQRRGEGIPTQQLCKEPLPEGSGHPRRPEAASVPIYGGGDGSDSAYLPRSGKDVAPMKFSENDGEENSP